jgi:hypothetical protein
MPRLTGASKPDAPEFRDYPGHRVALLEIEPYGGSIVLHLCEDIRAAFEESGLKGDLASVAEAFTWMSSARMDVHVFYPEGPTVGTIAHESLHAVTEVLTKAGIEFCDHTEEVWAYHLQNVCDHTIDFAMEVKNIVKNKALTKNKPARRVKTSATQA